MTLQDSTVNDVVGASRLGRKRDHTRDAEILTAALDVLAETGYEGMTVDMVAARAKAGKATVYRRWPSKAELVVDAVGCMKQIDIERLPDTGTLRGDLLGAIAPQSMHDAERKLKVMAGVMSMLSKDPGLADAVNAAITEPRARANRMLLQRAVDRGEIAAGTDIETIASIAPSMTAYRVLVTQQPVDQAYLVSLIDGVVLPALGLRSGAADGSAGSPSRARSATATDAPQH